MNKYIITGIFFCSMFFARAGAVADPTATLGDDHRPKNNEVVNNVNLAVIPKEGDLETQDELYKTSNKSLNNMEQSENADAVYGLDVSHYQSQIDWNQVRNFQNHKISYVYIKATEGAYLNDSYYQKNIEDAHRMGIPVGSYHYFSTNISGRVQFEHFKNAVNKEKQDLVPMVDVEGRRWASPSLCANLHEFLDCCEAYYGVKPIIYTGVFFYNTYLAQQFKGYQFFIARYSDYEPTLIDGQNWDLWQFTDKGSIQGISGHVDVSRMNSGLDINRIRIHKNPYTNVRRELKPNALPGIDIGEMGTGRLFFKNK